jgi:hypothetical protein
VGVLLGDTLAVGADAREGGALEGGEGTSGGVSGVSSSAGLGLGLGGEGDLSLVGEDGLSSGGDGLSSGGGDDVSRSAEGSGLGSFCGFSEVSGDSSSSSSSISDHPKINGRPPA